MDNFQNDPSGLKSDNQLDTPQDQSTPTPGTTSSEGAPYTPEVLSKSESPGSTEISAPPEKIPVPEAYTETQQSTDQQPQKSPQQDVQIKEPSEPAKVVDKTQKHVNVQHIDTPGDKTTARADKEEEHFIEEVEKHHGGH
ncbi:hypothetical protein ACFL0C_01310 [Patescibacteria group bacterium]